MKTLSHSMGERTAIGILLACIVCVALPPALAADWPQWRYDAGRTAASPEQLPAELHLQWVRSLPAPKPAWPDSPRLLFDASYEPVVQGKTIFVPSMVTDSVTALDTDTGAERWRFFADGPVRFAPVAWQGKVYFVSDDGYLYCLTAADGKLLWRYRGLPPDKTDRKVVGNQRLISLSPARGGPVIADGIVYFAAGIWPATGVFVHALDAETGKAVWSNTDGHNIEKANLDHGVRSTAGLTPQGYLAAIGDKLVIPCGAQLPGFLNRETGALAAAYTTGWGGRVGLAKGSCFVAGTDRYLIHGGDLFDVTRPNDEKFQKSQADFKGLLYPGGFTRLQIDRSCQKALGQHRRPVLASDAMYYDLPGTGIVGVDITAAKIIERAKVEVPQLRRNDEYPDKWVATFPELWRMPSVSKVHIKAGSRLYTGGHGVVEAIDIPQQSDEPKVSWRADIEGTPYRMLAADGKLFVVTLEGRVYAFGAKDPGDVAVYKWPESLSASKTDKWTGAAARLLKETKVSEGYAVVLGAGTGRLAEELVRQSQLHVLVVEPDAQKVATLRTRFHEARIYGTRIAVVPGDPLTYPLPPYLASLVVSEDIAAVAGAFDRAATQKIFQKIFHPLRPYGGTAYLSLPAAELATLADEIPKWNLPEAEVRRLDGALLLTRRGPLPGAADWSHDGANAANTGASGDQFARTPLGLLWFDGPMRWHRKPGSAVVRVAGGRVLVMTNKLNAMDVYTGRPLWEAVFPPSLGTALGGDIAAVEDAIYVACGKTCLALDPATGKELRRIVLPGEIASASQSRLLNLRVSGDRLFGTVGRTVVCMDRRTGESPWSYQANEPRLSIAVGGGKVFCGELVARNRRGETTAKRDTRTLALDAETGELLWQLSSGATVRYSQPHDLLVTTSGVYQAKDGTRVRDSRAAWCIAGDQLISGTPEMIETHSLLTGEQSGAPLTWIRRGCTGVRASLHLVTTRVGGNAAYVDLESRQISRVLGVRPACNNNLLPANGVLNAPNLTGGCTCNYMPTSLGLVPTTVIDRNGGR